MGAIWEGFTKSAGHPSRAEPAGLRVEGSTPQAPGRLSFTLPGASTLQGFVRVPVVPGI